ncbi:MAG: polymer-forming cytoskeletal protein [Acidobacteriota bacterium]|nr:polymer-forming cytoskeletal protein [Acidobacteriota bacterium]
MSIPNGRDNSTVLDEPALEDVSDRASLQDALDQPSPQNAVDQPLADAFDPRRYFDRWLEDIQGGPKNPTSETQEKEAEGSSGIFTESLQGSDCEVTFEGVLHFNGHSIGNISSPEGTLVLTRTGRIEADINVGVAVINGSVTGNITAAERVLLDSNAQVTGKIITPLLSVRVGAIFDGDCWFTSSPEPTVAEKPVKEQPEKLKRMAAGA